ncbi:competence protein ComK [Bacillus sp. PS06]|nr:competence protein ComK [Bacillus sp. PS06]
MKSLKRCLDDYEINPYTMIILPVPYGRKIYSIVIEMEEEFLVKLKPMEIIDRSCKYFGSSFKGRKEGTRELMGITHKPPIIIEPSHHMFFFPTVSPTSSDCAWLSHSHIINHSAAGIGTTKVIFQNNKSIFLDISKGSFENQFYHTAQLRTIISSRMENKTHPYVTKMPPTKLEEFISEDMFDLNNYGLDSE